VRPRTGARVLLAAIWLIGCATPPTSSAPPVAPPPAQLDASTSLASNPFCPRIAHIVVRKSEHLLVAQCDPGPVIAMTVAIGRSPVGTKLARGDQRTPEGNYRVSGPAHRSRFHLLIPIDYPSRRDADAALARGAITPGEHARILARRSQDRPPPQDTALGGHLGLHGEGREWLGESDGLDWTFGCIAMSDAEIEFLAQRVRRGTPVWIQP
jgi:murein L,D-transpeptidase YafK